MPFITAAVATSIAVGGAVGVGGAGLAAGLTGAAILGTAAFGAASLIGSIAGGGSKKPSAAGGQQVSQETGLLTPSESSTIARSRAFRAASIFTSPTGINTPANTSQARLK